MTMLDMPVYLNVKKGKQYERMNQNFFEKLSMHEVGRQSWLLNSWLLKFLLTHDIFDKVNVILDEGKIHLKTLSEKYKLEY